MIRSRIRRSSRVMPAVPSTTRTAISVLLSTWYAFWTLSDPSAPSSSSPGVSIMTTGPRGSSSMAFSTGTVVVPLTSDTMARLCPVRALMMLDFPALRLPKMPMCTRSEEGVLFRLIVHIPPLGLDGSIIRNGNLFGCLPGSVSDSPGLPRAPFHSVR